MKAIYKKELRLFYTTMTGYVAAAMMLVLVGVCSHVVNLKGGLSGLEYALLSSRWALALVVPVLTMRSFVEEKKQHTDLLLSASPVTPAQIVLGKFFATATVYALPLAVVGFYPLIFSAYGSIDLPSALLALLAMLLLGLALIPIGMFISSLTESYVVATLVSIGAMMLMYFFTDIGSMASDSGTVALIVLTALVVGLVAVVYLLTRSSAAAVMTGVVLELACVVAYFISSAALTSLLRSLLSWLGLFSMSQNLFSGVLDIPAIVYYLSITGLFLFLCAGTLERRRWN